MLAHVVLAVGLAFTEPEVVDVALTQVAADIVREAGLPHKVTVLVPQSWRAAGIVNATTNWTAIADVVLIRISPILVDELNAVEMRALLAHELAHTRAGCGPKFKTRAQALACEHRADVLSARWVGSTAALRALCHVMAISFDWRYTTDVSFSIERIRLLHNHKDIP